MWVAGTGVPSVQWKAGAPLLEDSDPRYDPSLTYEERSKYRKQWRGRGLGVKAMVSAVFSQLASSLDSY